MKNTTKLAALLLCAPLQAAAQGQMNMQGMSGLLNIPDASVLEYGVASFSHDRQVDGRFSKPRTLNSAGNDFVVGAGAFPHVEMVGRNVTTTTTAGGSDLSFNVKLQLPWQLLPGLDVAIGEMDLGGSVNEYDTQYVAATYAYGSLRATAGYGKADGKAATGTGRLNGAFYGAEYLATDWLSLLVEDDVHSVNAGVRLSLPERWLPEDWRLSASWMLSQEEGVDGRQDWYGVALSLPLAESFERSLPKSRERSLPAVAARQRGVVIEEVLPAADDAQYINPDYAEQMRAAKIEGKAQRLREHFRHADFEHVRVQRQGDEWLIAFENYRYNRNVVDALGVGAGLAARVLDDGERFYLQMERFGIPVFGLGGDSAAWQQFLNDGGGLPESVMVAAPSNRLRRRSEHGVLGGIARSTLDYIAFRPRISLRPVLSSTVGTEFGVLDYSLAGRADMALPLWQGAVLNITRDWSIYETKDFTEDGPFGGVFRNQRVPSGLRDRIITQTFRHGRGFTTMVSAGRFFRANDGVMLESRWEPGDGRHRFRVIATDFDIKHQPGQKREARLYSWRYFAQSSNTELNVTAGKFSAGDNGYKLDFTQHIGDTRLHFIYKKSEEDAFAGIGISIPLAPRRDLPRVAGLQIAGDPSWRYDLTTILGEQGNRLVFGPNVIPTAGFNLRNAYFNTDRLSPAYVRANQERLRAAWQSYGF